MASPKELRQAIIEARADLQAAFHDAHEAWNTKPAGAQEGEDAWPPAEVAKHVIGTEVFFASAVSQACGAPKVDMPEYDTSTPAAAAASLTRLGAIADNILRHVSDGDLPKTHQLRMGEMSVEQMLALVASHGKGHAEQIRAVVK